MEWEEEWARAGRAVSAASRCSLASLLCPVPEECAQSGVGVGGRYETRPVIIFSLGGSKETKLQCQFRILSLPASIIFSALKKKSSTMPPSVERRSNMNM